MNLKKMKISKYLTTTAILAFPGGALIAYAANCIDTVILALLFGGVGASLVGMAISAKNYKQLISPMKSVIDNLEVLISSSKIKEVAEIKNIYDINNAFARVIDNLTDNLKKITVQIEDVSGQIVSFSEQATSGARETASAIGQISGNIQQSTANSQHIAGVADKTADHAREGNEGIARIAEQMDIIKSVNNANGEVIKSLKESADKINQIVQLITKFADQTNLLALNAAIESARAGEHGRGFAVVAEEVRKLAEQSAVSAKEIHSIIVIIQNNIEKASRVMDEGIIEAERGSEVVRDVAEKFRKIIISVQDLAGGIQEVATATEEMSSAVQNVNAVAEEQSAAMEELTSSAHILKNLTMDLEKLADRFKI